MCLLCVIPPQTIPSRDKLEAAALNNPHGFGFAIVVPEDRRIIRERTMDPDEAINRFLELRGKYNTGYAMWHARLATHGKMNVDNCHPFMVGNTDTYLAHNGVLPVADDPTDERSDTRIFAEDILAKIGGAPALDNPHIFDMIEDFTSGSKIAVLTVDPRAKYQCYLLHENKGWKETNGIWWSNSSCYIDYYKSTATTSSYRDPYYDKEIDDKCPQCSADVDPSWYSDLSEGMCYFCGACLYCEAKAVDCLCYNPVTDKKLVTSDRIPYAWNDWDY